ncbi:small subunit ribosomal protein S9 [Saccharopolyspora kobensis]|uniref:Small ribosomal subunit protein uS9 n=1 Tax=Saccharopolyspora kobensis TaxID=146035 RepID=A0A1H6ECD9_9PSEU|nr:30S ribosomal protein S9 [Saccharopolyspora kobensis]SEG95412.1 small subunit ribosomal protein S9 [Saccharopolyspora kobensis]SFD56617.1 small subunit ribosomal protein S9 [Saccharopolyspora kobensis]
MNAPEETAAEETAEVAEVEVEEAAPAPLPVPTGRPVQTVGRRKEAVVRVRLVPGNGGFKLNGKALEQYFPNKVHQQIVKEPLVTVERLESFDVLATLRGGGPSGQAGALRMAIARALVAYDGDDRPALKKAGMLTRDAREKERKKYGLKKARKAPQFSKR